MQLKKTVIILDILLLCICLPAKYAVANDFILPALNQIAHTIQSEYYIKVPLTRIYTGAAKEIAKHKRLQVGNMDETQFNSFFNRCMQAAPNEGSILAKYAVQGMLSSLNDPYALFFDTPQWNDYKRMIQGGEFAGIGIELAKRDGNFVIVAPISGSPAEKAGIRSGDIVYSVNGHRYNGDDATFISYFDGEVGSSLPLKVKRGGKLLKFNAIREKLVMPHTSASIFKVENEAIGYLRIFYFSQGSVAEAFKYLNKFQSKQIGKIVIDLRDNPGGDLKSAISLASAFVGGATILQEKSKGEIPVPIYGNGNRKYNFKAAILINSASASCSEIFASCMQENRVAFLVGEKSFGKALIQAVFSLPGDAGCKLTTKRYYTCKGRDILYRGIVPDYKISTTSLPNSKDSVVKFALKKLK